MKCVFLDCDTLGQDTDLSVITELMKTSCFNNTQKKNEIIIERLQNADAVISNKVPIRQEVIEACPQLKVIFTAATGVDHIDTAFAAKRNIPVCNTRNYAGPSVVQHVMASILYFANKQHEYNASITDRTWSQQELFCLFTPAITELAGKTLGIIGYGNLGKQVASVAKAFGMQIKVAESFSNKQEDTDRFPLSEILLTSDFISLHCPLTEQTKYLFHKKTFEQMKSNAVLINTARGDIVDTNALSTNTMHRLQIELGHSKSYSAYSLQQLLSLPAKPSVLLDMVTLANKLQAWQKLLVCKLKLLKAFQINKKTPIDSLCLRFY